MSRRHAARSPAVALLLCLAAMPAVAKERGCRVDLADYAALKTGDTVTAVTARLGCRGRRRTHMTIGRQRRATYSWRGEGRRGANMLLTFKNGRLTDKSQLGLD